MLAKIKMFPINVELLRVETLFIETLLFFLVWFLTTAVIWIAMKRAFEYYLFFNENNIGFILFAVSAGGLVACGIRLWGGIFIVIIGIIAIILIGLIIYRVLRIFEIMLGTEMIKAKRSFLEEKLRTMKAIVEDLYETMNEDKKSRRYY